MNKKFYINKGIRIIMLLALCILVVITAKANLKTDEEQYFILHADMERQMNYFYDAKEELLLFREIQEAEKGDYSKAEYFKSLRLNRENWYINLENQLPKEKVFLQSQ